MSKYKLMLAHSYDPERITSWQNWTIEAKMDGVRVIVEVNDGNHVVYKSRNGRRLYMFAHLSQLFRKLSSRLRRLYPEYRNGLVFDGEMLGKKFARIAGDIHRKNYTATDARFLCFHVMPLNAFEDRKDTQPQAVRLRQLRTVCKTVRLKDNFMLTEPLPIRSHRKVLRAYRKLRKHRLHGLQVEGALVKDYNQAWVGKRTYAWMKLKECKSVDLRVVAVKPGKKGGKWEGKCGALVVVYKGVRIPVSGMTDALRKRANKLVGRVIEVSFQEVTEAGSLRHARFIRLRDDKDDRLSKAS